MKFSIAETGEPGRFRISSAENVSFQTFFRGLVEEKNYCLHWNQVMASVPLDAFFWELPALDQGCLGRAFECMVMDAPLLNRPANPAAFVGQFSKCSACVTRFRNLGRDAHLVVPAPGPGKVQEFSHLAEFCRNADEGTAVAFWKLSGDTVLQEIGESTKWVSTSGAGVPWLHLRIDSYPKYYVYRPYRTAI